MKHLTNGAQRVTPRRQEQILQHVGPSGLQHYAQEIAEYNVTDSLQAGPGRSSWTCSFVAGDLLSVVAGMKGDGPLKIVILDCRLQLLVLSSTLSGPCRAGARVPHSGEYTVCVRTMDLTGLGPQACDAVAFKLSRTRQLPKRRCARQEPHRRPIHPRFVTA
jgi:hypothetical protein